MGTKGGTSQSVQGDLRFFGSSQEVLNGEVLQVRGPNRREQYGELKVVRGKKRRGFQLGMAKCEYHSRREEVEYFNRQWEE